jgi:hypothetical protein
MLRNFASFKTISFRRAALAGVVALIAAAAFVGNTTPAAAFGFHGGSMRFHGGMGGFHGGMGGFHGGMGGFRHNFDDRFRFGGFHRDFDDRFRFGRFNHDFDDRFRFARFHRDFDDRFAFVGLGFFPGNDGCLRRVWGPYGWRWINVCY